MTKNDKSESSVKTPPDVTDFLVLGGLALIFAGIALVNLPMALFTTGFLLYTPAIITALR